MGKPTISKFSVLLAASDKSERVKNDFKKFIKGKFSADKIDRSVKEIDHKLFCKILLKILNKITAHKDGNKTDPKIKFKFLDWIILSIKFDRWGVKL